jgi:hypothetical protein
MTARGNADVAQTVCDHRPMTVWIALLRAVNLGVRIKVPMAALRVHLTAAGFAGVRTHLQSGNVILSSERGGAEVAALVRAVLRDEFGSVLVRSADRLAGIVAANPFAAAAKERPVMVRVIFLPAERGDGRPAARPARHRAQLGDHHQTAGTGREESGAEDLELPQ